MSEFLIDLDSKYYIVALAVILGITYLISLKTGSRWKRMIALFAVSAAFCLFFYNAKGRDSFETMDRTAPYEFGTLPGYDNTWCFGETTFGYGTGVGEWRNGILANRFSTYASTLKLSGEVAGIYVKKDLYSKSDDNGDYLAEGTPIVMSLSSKGEVWLYGSGGSYFSDYKRSWGISQDGAEGKIIWSDSNGDIQYRASFDISDGSGEISVSSDLEVPYGSYLKIADEGRELSEDEYLELINPEGILVGTYILPGTEIGGAMTIRKDHSVTYYQEGWEKPLNAGKFDRESVSFRDDYGYYSACYVNMPYSEKLRYYVIADADCVPEIYIRLYMEDLRNDYRIASKVFLEENVYNDEEYFNYLKKSIGFDGPDKVDVRKRPSYRIIDLSDEKKTAEEYQELIDRYRDLPEDAPEFEEALNKVEERYVEYLQGLVGKWPDYIDKELSSDDSSISEDDTEDESRMYCVLTDLTELPEDVSQLRVKTISATGKLEGYPPTNVLDGDETTSWQSGINDVDEYNSEDYDKHKALQFEFGQYVQIDYIVINNGTPDSEKRYFNNGRAKEISFTDMTLDPARDDGEHIWTDSIELPDEPQTLIIECHNMDTEELILRIDKAYKGKKYKELCIADVLFYTTDKK